MKKKSWDKFLLIATATVATGLCGWFITKALAFRDQFEMTKVVPNYEMPPTKIDQTGAATTFVQKATDWDLPQKGDAPKPLPLFVSIPIVEMNGILIDMLDPKAPLLREPVPNVWLLNNRLEFLNKNVLNLDPDRDGYSNLEEWTGQTDPQNKEAHPPYADKLAMKKREAEVYKALFAARPDNTKFQIKRLPTAKWPKPENFYLAIGETSSDNQLRLDAFEEKQAQSKIGIVVDASILSVTFLPKGSTHQLIRNIPNDISIYYAELEFLLDPGKKFYVKEGDTFTLPVDPGTKYRLVKVEEISATITFQLPSGESKTIELKKN